MDAEQIRIRLQAISSELLNLSAQLTSEAPLAPDWAIEKADSGICLECDKPIGKARCVQGCHESCYRRIHRRIDAGLLTEVDAIANGVLLPKSKPGRKRIHAEDSNAERLIAEGHKDIAAAEAKKAAEVAAKIGKPAKRKKAGGSAGGA